MGFWREIHVSTGLAIDSIRAHKLRSFLTLLGVIIGVASVVLVGAAIDGLGVYAEGITARAFGTDSFLVAQVAQVGNMSRRQMVEKQKRNRRMRREEFDFLKTANGEDILYSPYANRIDDVKGDDQTYEGAMILASSYVMPEIRDVPIEEGRYFTEQEEQLRRPVAVIGTDIRDALFPGGSCIGKKIRVAGQEFVVIGLMEKQGSNMGRSLDNPVYIPITVFNSMYGTSGGYMIFGKAKPASGLTMNDALDDTRGALRAKFHTPPGEPDNFDTLTPDSIRGFVDQILGVIAAVVVPVTSISLIVGGIVIMNIMLVSVTERTSEIGLRKSLGARRIDILLQFLTESVLLSLAGGTLGVAAGFLLAMVLSSLFGLTLSVTLPYVVISIVVSTVVGVVSGVYPARRAAQMDPVVALRAE